METICIVPLLAGAKGSPNRNTQSLCDKPLFSWVIDTLIASKLTPHLWVITDCPDVRRVLRETYHPVVKVYNLKGKSTHNGLAVEALLFEFLAAHPQPTDSWIVLAQATSPFTTRADFKKLFDKIKRNKRDQSFLACVLSKRFRWSANGQPLDYVLGQKPQPHCFAGNWIETGAFYATTVGALQENRAITSAPVGMVEIGPEARIDVDELLNAHQ